MISLYQRNRRGKNGVIEVAMLLLIVTGSNTVASKSKRGRQIPIQTLTSRLVPSTAVDAAFGMPPADTSVAADALALLR